VDGKGGAGMVYAVDNKSLPVIPSLTAIALIVTAVVTGIGDKYCVLLVVGVLPLVV
jgi:hypothetical protein